MTPRNCSSRPYSSRPYSSPPYSPRPCSPRFFSLRAFSGRLLSLAAAALTLLLAGCGTQPGSAADDGSDTFDWVTSSPPGKSNSRIRHLVLHYTDDDLRGSLISLTGSQVSAHYLLSAPMPETGLPRVYPLVPEARRAWHAGVSQWGERSNLNDTSIGIEIVNAGPLALVPMQTSEQEDARAAVARRWSPSRDFAPWSEAQISALITLLKPIIAHHGIKAVDVVGHSDIAPERKTDPGPRFPWQRLHDAGIGAWPRTSDVLCFQRQLASEGLPSHEDLLTALTHYGYPVDHARPELAIAAFQAHFRPGAISGTFDAESVAILLALNARYRQSLGCLPS
ncbi:MULTISPECIES: N-acetylmuramoyl-L-alanine amidase [unclassified Cobetia]|uniref:N-acetylmuramoyl-L-alanine amidase n=1 Tax=unclassified Cobetia TaxID=2609414 RepID=UPI0020981CCD|nr:MULTISPECIES: N-acetylmuramoyl-L-alanine amidase [unclassified Cobetia]MCO7233910.1 N-acetylmuramoyl-L-alanine amidase [Cobetia sp. Dlab-2-AX]MCO7237200.1 N-acetylmuramoyl-L-alanine amidase [Cobetia sp. Dlab-2-U]